MVKSLHSQCKGPEFDPWSGNQIPHAATKSSHAVKRNEFESVLVEWMNLERMMILALSSTEVFLLLSTLFGP